jgi:glycine hydroxymethyltransferase
MPRDLDALLCACADRLPQLQTQRLMLYAGANLPSPRAMAAYNPALSAYPAMGPTGHKEQPDTDLVSKLESFTTQAAMTLFNAAWAEVRLASCTLANLAIFHAYCQPGDTVLAPAAEHGGHLSQRQGGTPQLAGLVVEDLPYDRHNCTLDTARAAEMIMRIRPKPKPVGGNTLRALSATARLCTDRCSTSACLSSGPTSGKCIPINCCSRFPSTPTPAR